MQIIRWFLLCILFAGLASCRPVLSLEDPNASLPTSWQAVFESFWQGMNNNYLFWSNDPTDWDAVYTKYQPLFSQLNIHRSADSSLAFSYFYEITKNLIDGHYSLSIQDLSGHGIQITPALARIYESLGVDYLAFILHQAGLSPVAPNIPSSVQNHEVQAENQKTILPALKKKSWKSFEYFTTSSWLNDKAGTGLGDLSVSLGRTNDNFVYFGFSSFSFTAVISTLSQLGEGYTPPTKLPAEMTNPPVIAQALNQRIYEELYWVNRILEKFYELIKDNTVQGLIIDLRGNGGGYIMDLSLLWGKLIQENRIIAYNRSKMGDNRLDYGPWMPQYVYADPKAGTSFTRPIAVLINKGSVSAAELSALFFKSLPNACLIGGQSMGGQGGLTQNRVLNGGQFFINKNTSFIYTPSVQTKSYDGIFYEGSGIPPDIPIVFSKVRLDVANDPRLDEAFKWLKSR